MDCSTSWRCRINGAASPARRAVFLDRDGTVNIEAGYIRDLADLKLMDGAADAIRRLREAGFLAILVTNQSGPARGYYPESWIWQLNNRLTSLLHDGGTTLDGVYYCPHLPDGSTQSYRKDCNCRKPETAMLQWAARDYGIDLTASYMVGDKATDVEVGQNAGTSAILLTSGYGEQVLAGTYQSLKLIPEHIAPDLAAAAEWILAQG
ncbi:MAG: HAD family hydrolase [Candidatus Sericytochromatia bacterium]|nr:HAD family hydrolase [Candidatus Sericytochromatia bacterium]